MTPNEGSSLPFIVRGIEGDIHDLSVSLAPICLTWNAYGTGSHAGAWDQVKAEPLLKSTQGIEGKSNAEISRTVFSLAELICSQMCYSIFLRCLA